MSSNTKDAEIINQSIRLINQIVFLVSSIKSKSIDLNSCCIKVLNELAITKNSILLLESKIKSEQTNSIIPIDNQTKLEEKHIIKDNETGNIIENATTNQKKQIEHGIRFLKAIPFSIIPSGNSVIERLFEKDIIENDYSDVVQSILIKTTLSFFCGCLAECGKTTYSLAGVFRSGLVWLFDPALIALRNYIKSTKLYYIWFSLLCMGSFLLNIGLKQLTDEFKTKDKCNCCFKQHSCCKNKKNSKF